MRYQPRADVMVDAGEKMAGLPAPVARYFAFALSANRPHITKARATWVGTFLTKRDAKPSAFTAVQHFTVRPPGFVWDAKIKMLPLVPVFVRDSYVDGDGAMYARVAGLIPMTDQRGTREIAEASLQRFLGECVWLPTALLPGSGVEWTAKDDDTARATLTDRGNTASVEFRFGERGEITGCNAMRQRDVDGEPVLTPWRTRTCDYVRVDGMRIPRYAEAAWMLPCGPLTYWRGRLDRIAYEYETPVSRHVGAR